MTDKKKRKKAMNAEITRNLFDDFDKFEYFMVTYWKQIAVFCALVIVGVGVAVFAVQHTKNARSEAISAIAAAESEAELRKVITDFSAYVQTADARMRLAALLRNEKKYAEAREQYEILLKTKLKGEIRYRLMLDIAYLNELSGENEKAAGAFAKVAADSFCPEAFRAEGAYGAGRLYAAVNKLPEAERYLKQAAERKIDAQRSIGLWRRQASLMLERLKEKQRTTQAPDGKESAKS